MRLCLLFIFLLAMSACTIPESPQINEPAPTPIITPAIPVDTLSIENSGHLSEILTLASTSHEPIAALVFTNSAQVLMAIHAPSGLLVRWDLASGKQLSTLNVGPVGIGAASFDREGRWLVTAAGATPPAVEAGLAAQLDGYRLFDTRDGTLVRESRPPDLPLYYPLTDVALSPDGKWIADTTAGGIAVSERSTGKPQRSIVISSNSDPDFGNYRIEQNATTFDWDGEWAAFIDDHGQVTYVQTANRENEGVSNMGVREPALALAIDPSRRYFATATTNKLMMREIKLSIWNAFGLPGLIDEAVASGPAAGLVFSPDGTLLAVSTHTNWQLWSVAKRRRLLLEEQGAYSITFSSDGRLIAVGGTDGVIHVWGIPLNQP